MSFTCSVVVNLSFCTFLHTLLFELQMWYNNQLISILDNVDGSWYRANKNFLTFVEQNLSQGTSF